MKIIQTEQQRPFKPYAIQVDTKEEHDFLYGLFDLSEYVEKGHANGFNREIEADFFKLLDNHQLNGGAE
jgi:hypothetical protein